MKTQVPCFVCGAELTRESDYLDGHALLESSVDCGRCGYQSQFAYGYSREWIGTWHDEHSWDVATPRSRRDNSRPVALLVRRYQLGLLSGEEEAFARCLDMNREDYTAAKVYADWLDERGRETEAYRFRNYDEPWGFPL